MGCQSTTFPKSVTAIGYGAFVGCKSLTDTTLPKSVKAIDDWAFAGCTALTRVKLPAALQSIGESLFQDCSALTDITLPKSVTSIGESAFAYCSALKGVKVGWAVPPSISADVFLDVPMSGCTLYVPKGTAAQYKSAAVWKDFGDIKEF